MYSIKCYLRSSHVYLRNVREVRVEHEFHELSCDTTFDWVYDREQSAINCRTYEHQNIHYMNTLKRTRICRRESLLNRRYCTISFSYHGITHGSTFQFA